jgi:tetratricopeptide (TPR) repeat protein
MMKKERLAQAEHFIRRKKYDKAIRLLDADDNRFADTFRSKYLCALAYLRSGAYGMAFNYFESAKRERMLDPDTLLGMACAYIAHGDTDKAVDIYLEVQDMDERNPVARRGLAAIKKYAGTDAFVDWIESGGLRRLCPRLKRPRRSPLKAAVLIGVVLGAALGACLLADRSGLVALPFFHRQGPARPGFTDLALASEEEAAPMQTEGAYRYILTRQETLRLYGEARRLFTTWHDEAARVNVNKISDSNAPEGIKNKAALLASYLAAPGFDTLKDRIPYRDVADDPRLYRGCHVIWRGRAANIEAEKNRTAFNLLVGYDSGTMMEGIVQTTFAFAANVNPALPLAVLGRIVPLAEGGFRLEGLALQQAGLGPPGGEK